MKVYIPTPLRQYTDKRPAVEVSGRTVGEALQNLIGEHRELRRHLYGEGGQLRAFVNIYVNDEDIRYLEHEDTPLRESDNISIVPSIAGGSAEGRPVSTVR